nr:transglutaminase-like domain-containing protein [Vallitaleaceae bacterium]
VTNITTEDYITVNRDLDKNTFNIENYDYRILEETIAYGYDALSIDTNDPQLVDLLRSSDNERDYSGTIYELPEGYDYVTTITDDIVADGMSDYDKTKAILAYLKDGFVYNITPPLPMSDNADRIQFFLEGSKEGFCQHFSTAAILMLRSQGIPGRYVSGYLVDYDIDYANIQFQPELADALAAGNVLVKDSDAHTWIEVYFEDVGWIPFEATGQADGSSLVQNNKPEIIEPVEAIPLGLSDQTKQVILIVFISFLGIVGVIGLYQSVRYIIRKKRYYRQGEPTRQVMIIVDIINDYLKALRFERKKYETYREYALRIDGYKISDMSYSDMILQYEGVVYGGFTVDEACRDDYADFLVDVRKSAKVHAGLLSVIKTNIKEWMTF